MHPLEGLINGSHQIFPASVIAVRALPHVISGLGGQDQLVAVRMPVAIHVNAEIALRLAVRRAIVVGEIKMRDSVVKRCSKQTLLHAKGRNVSKVMPQAQRNRREQNTAPAAASVNHGVISIFSGNVRHVCHSISVVSYLYFTYACKAKQPHIAAEIVQKRSFSSHSKTVIPVIFRSGQIVVLSSALSNFPVFPCVMRD